MKKVLTILLSGLVLLPAAAQSDDFGIWTEVGAEKKINRQFSANAGLDFRFENNVSKVNRYGLSVGVTYKPYKFLRFGAGYAYMNDWKAGEAKVNYDSEDNSQNGYNVDDAYRRNKHRFYFQATGRYFFDRFTLSLRERFQYTHFNAATTTRLKYRDALPFIPAGFTGTYYTYDEQDFANCTTVDKEKRAKNRYYLRSRLQLSYNVKGIPLEPYVAFELSNNLSSGFAVEKRRLSVGADYTIGKKHALGIAYIYSNGADDDDEGNLHAISLGYTFKF